MASVSSFQGPVVSFVPVVPEVAGHSTPPARSFQPHSATIHCRERPFSVPSFRHVLILAAVLSFARLVDARQTNTGTGTHTPATVRAGRMTRPPVIDGRLSEAEWAQGEPITSFGF